MDPVLSTRDSYHIHTLDKTYFTDSTAETGHRNSHTVACAHLRAGVASSWFFVVPFCKTHFSYADSPVESIYFLAAKSSAGGQDVCGTDVTQTAVAAPSVKVTSPKRSDGTYTTPFRVTFSTDGTAGVFVTYEERRERRGEERRGEERRGE